MVLPRRIAIITAILLLGSIVLFAALYLLPLHIIPIQQKPEQAPQKIYDYYEIIDADNGRSLMMVPLVVSVGDEVVTDENKRYQVFQIEENRAYARFVENVDIEKYKPKQ